VRKNLKTFSESPLSQRRLICLAVAGACATFVPAFAQTAGVPGDGTDGPKVVVTGIRASMQSTMNMKRNADGIVDGIVADDIGKFPDTNLAESLQRISGVSIDRSNGEGQKVTVRGLGPDFNLVLLNGRQMPTTDLSDLSGRSFDFSNLASEAISQLQVYKTGRADSPTGGIGATINVMTARPLDNPGMRASIGAKAVKDDSNNELPGAIKGSSVTPEFSGIYSNTSEDGRFGIAVSASHQRRDSGFNRAGLANGYQGPYLGSATLPEGSTLPQPGQPGSEKITNRPGPNDLYLIPQNFGYGVNAISRQRTNGQLVLQFRPVKELTTTLDLTYSEQKIQTKRNELSVWFGQTPTSTSTWPGGKVQTPLTYMETYNTPQDISVVGGDYATKTKNKSIGFNTVWKASNDLRLELDVHHSNAESGADSPWGTENNLSNASYSRGDTKVDFTKELPVVSMPAANLAAAPIQATGSWFHNSWQKATINQAQTKGSLKLFEASELNFGVGYTDSTNRSTYSNVQNNSWGGASKASDYPGSLFQANSLGSFFKEFGGHNAPELFGSLYTFDFGKVRAATAAATGLSTYLPNFDSADTDRELKEKTTSGYVSFGTDWDTAIPFHSSIGLRMERTKVTSVAQVLVGTDVVWESQNELPLKFAGKSYSTQEASYNNVLPSLNFDADLRPDMKLRASVGTTIGRPRYDQMQGGLTLGTIGNVFTGGTASVGNPALKPVKSKNLDLSWEWYYDQQSVLSIAGFHKKMDNYAGQTATSTSLYNLHTPVGGAYYTAARNAGCSAADTNCLRNYILTNFRGQPGVEYLGVKSDGNLDGKITGQPGDPLMPFLLTSYANQKSATVKGAEINVQHMFGRSGFGVQANYTYVTSPTKYDDANTADQFAILGLSNSANLVGIYEDQKWSIRLAYNWRDSFLASTIDAGGGRPAPVYTDKYGQTDVSIGYNVTEKLSLQAEVINLTNATQRQFGRTERSTLNVTQAGPRYMLGARYKF